MTNMTNQDGENPAQHNQILFTLSIRVSLE